MSLASGSEFCRSNHGKPQHRSGEAGPRAHYACSGACSGAEHYRSGSKNVPLESDHLEIPDKLPNLETLAISEETQKAVRKALSQLPDRDRSILRAIFLDELGKDEVCKKFGVGRDYLRVLVFRAKEKFRTVGSN